MDEGIAADERPPASVCDRAAFWLDLTGVTPRDLVVDEQAADICSARATLPEVTVPDDVLDGICHAAAALGIGSARAALFALTAARVIAALDQRRVVSAEDATTAGRLVLAPRATVVPLPPEAPPPRGMRRILPASPNFAPGSICSATCSRRRSRPTGWTGSP